MNPLIGLSAVGSIKNGIVKSKRTINGFTQVCRKDNRFHLNRKRRSFRRARANRPLLLCSFTGSIAAAWTYIRHVSIMCRLVSVRSDPGGVDLTRGNCGDWLLARTAPVVSPSSSPDGLVFWRRLGSTAPSIPWLAQSPGTKPYQKTDVRTYNIAPQCRTDRIRRGLDVWTG